MEKKLTAAYVLKNRAKVMTAAFDLLDACERTLRWLELTCKAEKMYIDPAIINILKEAIEKTRGET
ncbi:hypothetical protein LCGC14_2602120 [marine sediment metagenome]|uniref:Uncharacterized protein n=1 Tax=marine sediment metagenome TaxID=412755 RepID=A0A0F9CJG2_9ZZZZ